MADRPTYEGLKTRITADRKGGGLDERSALCWSGYLAGLLEWDLISVEDHRRLSELLPAIDDNPAVRILIGNG